jgi:hypothetical protein
VGKAAVVARVGLQIAVVAGLLVLAVLVATKDVDHEAVTAIATLVLAALVVSLLTPALLARMSKVTVGPFAFELVGEVKRGADEAAARGEADGDKIESLFRCRVLLEAKLTYIAKHLLAEDGRPTFINIGSLAYDGYLTDDEARAAYRILNLSEEVYGLLPKSEQEKVVKQSARFVKNVRASVFFGSVKVALAKARWSVSEVTRDDRTRPDLLAEKAGEHFVRLVPVFSPSAKQLKSAEDHLGRLQGFPEGPRHHWIVVPNTADDDEIAGHPLVVRVKDLPDRIAAS